MSTTALAGLLEYLYGTLSPSNMRWVGEHLIEFSKRGESEQVRPYTMEEIDDMLDEAEAAFEAGEYLSNDDVFHHRLTRGQTPCEVYSLEQLISNQKKLYI